jgi:4-amino-4-deoxy-L-arabinose transferase-like glycosyltransferase
MTGKWGSAIEHGRSWLPGVLILCLAAALRFAFLSENPPGLFRDEARKAYSTYSLLVTGNDLTGRTWPLQVKEFTAYTTPFYHWFSLPFIAGLGVTVFSTRALAALAGTVACLGVYLVGKTWGGKTAGILASLLLAISPWHLLFSRWANQGILMTAFLPLAVALTWRVLENEKRSWPQTVAASLLWALSWNAYEPNRLFVPFLLFALLALEARGWRSNKERPARLFLVGGLTLVFISPFLAGMALHWEETQARLAAVTAGQSWTPWGFLQNYLLHWNPFYLFVWGDANPRHHVWGQGQMTLLEGSACLLGAIALWKESPRWGGWLLAWLFLAPIPAAVTQESLPHALRTLMVVPALALLGGIGLAGLLDRAPQNRRKVAVLGLAAAFCLQGGLTAYFLFGVYPEKSGPYWESGFLEAIRTVEVNRQPGETCTLTGLVEFPEALVQFAVLPDPAKVQEGTPAPGYQFETTGKPLDPRAYPAPGLFLVRPNETPQPPWWKEIFPSDEDEAMTYSWKLYRSKGFTPAR